MSASVRIDPADPTPPFEQLRRQLADLIASGALPEGTRLSPVRQLAGDLGLAVGTVARAYRELEADALVVTRRGGGTRVAASRRLPAAEIRRRVDDLAQRYVSEAALVGAGPEDVRAALERHLTGGDERGGSSPDEAPQEMASERA